jgi:hypothetical protein
MRFWTYGSESSSVRRLLVLLLLTIPGSSVGMGGTGGIVASEAAEWRFTPRLSMSSGRENDLLLDPSLDRNVVPAGSFLDVRPGLLATTSLGPASDLRLQTEGAWERYFNADRRLLFAQSLSAEWLHWVAPRWHARLRASGSYFDDSQRSTVRRIGGGIEGGLAFVRRAWTVELFAGRGGRRYPALDVLSDTGVLGTYTEGSTTVGINAA